MCACGCDKRPGWRQCCESLKLQMPPIGLRPKHIAQSQRLQEIEEAMTRYLQAHKMIPGEWLVEYHELWKEMNKL